MHVSFRQPASVIKTLMGNTFAVIEKKKKKVLTGAASHRVPKFVLIHEIAVSLCCIARYCILRWWWLWEGGRGEQCVNGSLLAC